MFGRRDENGEVYRNRVVVDCSGDEPVTEQAHKDEVDINNIVRRHGGMTNVARTNALLAPEFRFDDVPGNDFQEAMAIVTRAQGQFDGLPSQVRKEFNNSPAEFLDFVQNPDNVDRMVELGLAQAPPVEPAPIQVQVVNPEAPPPIE